MNRSQSREKRKTRFKNRIKGDSDRPRLVVFRSNNHIYGQIVDDEKGVTLASASDAKLKEKAKPVELAEKAGEELGKLAIAKKIKKLVFDRNGYKYHGRVKSFADGVRKSGVSF